MLSTLTGYRRRRRPWPLPAAVAGALRKAAWLSLALTLLLALPQQGQAQAPAGICDRTPQVRDDILDWIRDDVACEDVTTAQLARISYLNLVNKGITSLKPGDFEGLINLKDLTLSYNALTMLPADLFSGLNILRGLYLDHNALKTLPADAFRGLNNLDTLYFRNNGLATLSADAFRGLNNLDTLDLDGNALTTLPANVFQDLTNLEFLRLQNNRLTTLSADAFRGLNNLRWLELHNNELATLPPDGFQSLTKLTWLKLDENALTTLPADAFRGLNNLEILSLSNNALTTLSADAFRGLNNLETLNLTNNALKRLPADGFQSLTNLRQLQIENNVVAAFSANAFRGLSNLTRLNLQNNALTTLPPDGFQSLTKLTWLELNENALTTLPEAAFSGLTRLRDLTLQSNVLTTLPEGLFSNLTSLKSLNLANNALTTLPEGLFSNLSNLETLDLNDNVLTALLADAFRGLSNLQGLYLSSNSMTALPADGFQSLTNLRYLHLDNNGLTTIPADGFQSLTNLQFLNLKENALTTLPADGFRGLANLKTLDLELNTLAALPAGAFRNLINLRRLDLQNNSLTTLPADAFRGLTNLQQLEIQVNALTTLPANVFQGLTNLGWLNLSRNALTSLPGALLDELQARVGLRGFLGSNPGYLGPGPFDFARTETVGVESFSIPNLGGWSITSNGTEADMRSGYGRISAEAGSTTPSGIAIFGFRQGGVLIAEAGVPASEPVQEGRIFAEVNGPVNTGLAMANPGDESATILFHFRDADGVRYGDGQFELGAYEQRAKFLNQEPFNSGNELSGTFTFTSSQPIAVIALRGLTNRDGEFLMTTLPVAPLASTSTDTVYFPHFTDGDGWVTQVILVNPTDETIAGTIQFVDQGSATADAAPAVLMLDDDRTGSEFPYSIPAGGSQRFTTSNPTGGTTSGSVRATPDDGSVAPSGLVVFSFTTGGKTVSEVGVNALTAGRAFRLYAESSGTPNQTGSIRTGLAIANAADTENTVTLEVTDLDGAMAMGVAPVMLSLPASGQVARFLDEIFDSLPGDFSGVLRITSTADVAIVGLRLRFNDRNELKMTTTPPSDETGALTMADRFFAHIVDSAGWSTQFVLFSGTAGEASSATLSFIDTAGEPWDLPTRNSDSDGSTSPN